MVVLSFQKPDDVLNFQVRMLCACARNSPIVIVLFQLEPLKLLTVQYEMGLTETPLTILKF